MARLPRQTKALRDIWMRLADPDALRRAREIKRWTQQEVATACGKTQNTISLLELGKQATLKDSLALDLTRVLDLDFERVFAEIPDHLLPGVSSCGATDGRLSA